MLELIAPKCRHGLTLVRIFPLTVVYTALAIISAGQSQAALLTFTDRIAFQTAVGNLTTENFNSIISDSLFTDSNISFSDLAIRSTGSASSAILVDVLAYQFNPGTADIDGTARVNLGGLLDASVVSIDFNSPVRAVGFDTINYDIDNDNAQAFVGATLIGDFPTLRGQTGFIGVLGTAGDTISSIEIRRAAGANETFNAFDNVSFSIVPEPTTMLLSILGLLSLSCCKLKRSRRQ